MPPLDHHSRTGHGQWRSLDEIADTPEFRAWLEDEFPERASLLTVDRRKFVQLMGASFALAGLAGCRFLPQRRAVPYVDPVEEQIPGKPLFYATSVVLSGVGIGVLARSNDGRPTKLEGNPLHPASLGATDAITQASLLDLYDPERLRTVMRMGRVATWDEFLAEAGSVLRAQKSARGEGVRIVTGAVTSPTLTAVMRRFMAQYPRARWIQWEPVHRDNVLRGMQEAFGRALQPVYRFDRADVVLTLDADPIDTLPGHVRYAHDIMSRRRVRSGNATMSRLYAVESMPTNMAATADHRLPVRPSDVAGIAAAIARGVGAVAGGPSSQTDGGAHGKWIDACVADLKKHSGRSVVVVGDHQPPIVHGLAAAINEALGNTGRTVEYIEPIYPDWQDPVAQLAELADELKAGKVRFLALLGVNPAYDAPADIAFAEAMGKAEFTVSAGLSPNETSRKCLWNLPEAHSLEAWGDCRAYDGTASVIQPLIQPLFDGKSQIEILSALSGRPASGYELVRAEWRTMLGGTDFERRWRRIIHDGVALDTAYKPVQVAFRRAEVFELRVEKQQAAEGLEVVFAPDPNVWDGRFAGNGWLQELPKPLTRLTWDNAALMAPSTAQSLGLSDSDEVELRLEGRSVRAPVRVQPGHPRGSVTLHLGGGRAAAGAVGSGVGFSAYAIRSRNAMWLAAGVEVRRTGGRYAFARTEQHHAIDRGRIDGMQGRDIVRVVPLSRLADGHEGTEKHGTHEGPHPSLYDARDHRYDGYKWAMSVDLTLCTGCNACVLACQAENNIPVVGKEQVQRGREMHWIRIDRYFEGDPDEPEIHQQPVMCMHCENAPCEPVCPVAATVHSHEGLNQMVYNRCVGTRYCSNNCPYKVRRFNFLNYANHHDVPIKQLLQNPNVTVRGRGVMEKCTFCVQRISAARIDAKKEGRAVRDGEIVTACQAACPTKAIVFGDISDPRSAVSLAKAEPRDYSLLDELNTRPRLTYLAKLTNKNPDLEREA
jgi:molybdopterin-containing oxidoreductase family iron-sulfur binding subunit